MVNRDAAEAGPGAGSSDTENRRKRPTMADVAHHVGVSKALVSIVFRGAAGASAETRERVLHGAAELGYRPDSFARGLRQHRSKHLGVLFTMRSPFESELVEQLYPVAERVGYRIVLGAMTASRDAETVIEELISYRSEAIVLIAPDLGTRRMTELAAQLPVVEVGRRVQGSGFDVVRNDDAHGVRQAVEHLVQLGHREIVHVDGGSRPGAADRRRGYRTAMRRNNLEPEIHVLNGDYTEEAGARAAAELVQWARLPTAVVAGNDQCAFGLLDSLRRVGVAVPHDVSVVGFDDTRYARLPFVDLTSVRQDSERMAELAVRSAVERLDSGRTESTSAALTPTLIARGTSGPPNGVDHADRPVR